MQFRKLQSAWIVVGVLAQHSIAQTDDGFRSDLYDDMYDDDANDAPTMPPTHGFPSTHTPSIQTKLPTSPPSSAEPTLPPLTSTPTGLPTSTAAPTDAPSFPISSLTNVFMPMDDAVCDATFPFVRTRVPMTQCRVLCRAVPACRGFSMELDTSTCKLHGADVSGSVWVLCSGVIQAHNVKMPIDKSSRSRHFFSNPKVLATRRRPRSCNFRCSDSGRHQCECKFCICTSSTSGT